MDPNCSGRGVGWGGMREQTASPSLTFTTNQTLGLLGQPNVILQSCNQLNSEMFVCAFHPHFFFFLLRPECLKKGRMKNKMLFLPACPCSPLSLFITRLSLLSLLLLKLISFPFSPIQGLNAECSIFHLRPLIALPPLTFYRYHIMGANLANY